MLSWMRRQPGEYTTEVRDIEGEILRTLNYHRSCQSVLRETTCTPARGVRK